MTARWRVVELDSLSERSESGLYIDFVKSKTMKIVNFVKSKTLKIVNCVKIPIVNFAKIEISKW